MSSDALGKWFEEQQAHGGIKAPDKYTATQIYNADADYKNNSAFRADETLDLVHGILANHYMGQVLAGNPEVRIDTVTCTESASLLGCFYAMENNSDAIAEEYINTHGPVIDFLASWFTVTSPSSPLNAPTKYLLVPVTHWSEKAWKQGNSEHSGSHWTLLVIVYDTTAHVTEPLIVYHLDSADDTTRFHNTQALRYRDGLNALLRKYRPVGQPTQRYYMSNKMPTTLSGQQQKTKEDVVSCGIYTLMFMHQLYRVVSSNATATDTFNKWNEFLNYMRLDMPTRVNDTYEKFLYGKYNRTTLRTELDNMVTPEFTSLLNGTITVKKASEVVNWMSDKLVLTDDIKNMTAAWLWDSRLFVESWTKTVEDEKDIGKQTDELQYMSELLDKLDAVINAFNRDAQRYVRVQSSWRRELIVLSATGSSKIDAILDPGGPFVGIKKKESYYRNVIASLQLAAVPAPVPVVVAPVSPTVPTTPSPALAPAPATVAPPPPATPAVVVPSPSPAAPPTAVPGVPASAAKTAIASRDEFRDALNRALGLSQPISDDWVNMALFYDANTAIEAKNKAATYNDATTLEIAIAELSSWITDNKTGIKDAFDLAYTNGFNDTVYDFDLGLMRIAYGRLKDIVKFDDFGAAQSYVNDYLRAYEERLKQFQIESPSDFIGALTAVTHTHTHALDKDDIFIIAMGLFPKAALQAIEEINKLQTVADVDKDKSDFEKAYERILDPTIQANILDAIGYALDAKRGNFTTTSYRFNAEMEEAHKRLVDMATSNSLNQSLTSLRQILSAIVARRNDLQPIRVVEIEPAPVLYSDQFLGRVPSLDEYERRENERPLTFRQRNAPGGGDSAADKYDRAVEARARDEFAAFAEARRLYERQHRALVHRY